MGRTENTARTRQALLATSLALFRSNGFEETRVQDIVEMVGVSPSTFFNYFPSKDAVLAAVSLDSTLAYIALLGAEIGETHRTSRTRLAEVAQTVVAFIEDDPGTAMLLATRTGLLTGALDELAEADRRGQHLVAELFAQGQDKGEFRRDRDPLQLAELFTVTLSQTTMNHLTDWFGPTPQPLGERVRLATEIILDGAALGSS